MALAAAVPLVMLLNPTWLERIPPPAGKPVLTILLDRSASMATRDADSGQTRYEAGAAIAAAVARDLKDRYDVRIRTFADRSSAVAAESLAQQEPDGAVTDLATAVQESFEEDQPQGQAALLLSDGIHNAGSVERLRQSIGKAKVMAAPVYVKTIGGPAAVSDIEVSLQQPQELAFVTQRVPVAVSVRQRGSLAAKIGVALLLDGKSVERREVALKPDDAVEQVFYISHAQSGLYRYEIRADSLPGEVTAVNDTGPLLLRVVDQPVRVLSGGQTVLGHEVPRADLVGRSVGGTDERGDSAEGRLLQRKIPRRMAAENEKAAKPASNAKAPPSPPTAPRARPAADHPGFSTSTAEDLAEMAVAVMARQAVLALTAFKTPTLEQLTRFDRTPRGFLPGELQTLLQHQTPYYLAHQPLTGGAGLNAEMMAARRRFEPVASSNHRCAPRPIATPG